MIFYLVHFEYLSQFNLAQTCKKKKQFVLAPTSGQKKYAALRVSCLTAAD